MSGHSMNIAFRADASLGIGVGHLMRCLALADELARTGARCTFVCASVVDIVQARILAHGHEFLTLPGAEPSDPIDWQDDANGTATALSGRNLDWLIADHYALDARWESRMRPWAKHMAIIDDLADRQHDTDLLLNQNVGVNASDYYSLVPTCCTLLLGPMNALLAPGFAQARIRKGTGRMVREGLHLVVTMGGTDPRRATLTVIEALENSLPASASITVVLGSSSAGLDAVIRKATNSNLDISLAVDVSDMAALLATADIAIAAAGSTLWELCCLAVPTIAVKTAENQNRTVRTLAALGAIMLIDDPELIRSHLPQMLATFMDGASRHRLACRAGNVTDGLGSRRVAAMMASKSHKRALPAQG